MPKVFPIFLFFNTVSLKNVENWGSNAQQELCAIPAFLKHLSDVTAGCIKSKINHDRMKTPGIFSSYSIELTNLYRCLQDARAVRSMQSFCFYRCSESRVFLSPNKKYFKTSQLLRQIHMTEYLKWNEILILINNRNVHLKKCLL